MPRPTVARQAQAHRLAQVRDPVKKHLVLVHERTVHAPSTDDRAWDRIIPRFFDRVSHVNSILGSHRIIGFPQLGRIGRAEGKEVGDVQRGAAPACAEAQAFADGRIIDLVIGRARIEHDERRDESCAHRRRRSSDRGGSGICHLGRSRLNGWS